MEGDYFSHLDTGTPAAPPTGGTDYFSHLTPATSATSAAPATPATPAGGTDYFAFLTQPAPRQPSRGFVGEMRNSAYSALVDSNPEMVGNALEALAVVLEDTDASAGVSVPGLPAGVRVKPGSVKFGALTGDRGPSTDTASSQLRQVAADIQAFAKKGQAERRPAVGKPSEIRTDTLGNAVGDTLDFIAGGIGQAIGTSAPSIATGIAAGAVSENPVVAFFGGYFGPSYVQNLGDTYGYIRDDKDVQAAIASGKLTKKQAAAISMAAAVPMALLDAIPEERLFGASVKELKGNIVKRMLKRAAIGAAMETPAEGMQQGIEEVALDIAGGKKTVYEQALNVLDAALGGLVGGTALGGVWPGPRAEETAQPPPPGAIQPGAGAPPPAGPPGAPGALPADLIIPPEEGAGPPPPPPTQSNRVTISDPAFTAADGTEQPAGDLDGQTVTVLQQGDSMSIVQTPDGQRRQVGNTLIQPAAQQPAGVPAAAPAPGVTPGQQAVAADLPRQVANAADVPDSQHLTPLDRQSPIPNDIIHDGKEIVTQATGQPSTFTTTTEINGKRQTVTGNVADMVAADRAQTTALIQQITAGVSPQQIAPQTPLAAPPARTTEVPATTLPAEAPAAVGAPVAAPAPIDVPSEDIVGPAGQRAQLVDAEVRESLADGRMDATGGQSPVDVAISNVQDAISGGETHSPNGAPWRDVLAALQARQPAAGAPVAALTQQAAPRAPGETDKEFAKRVIDKRPEPTTLPEKYDSYFIMDKAQIVPIGDLVSSKTDEENKKGGGNAAKRMEAAAQGELEKRDPITVERMPNGKYLIKDGNGTYTSVKGYGWQSMPVLIEGETTPAAEAPAAEAPAAAPEVRELYHVTSAPAGARLEPRQPEMPAGLDASHQQQAGVYFATTPEDAGSYFTRARKRGSARLEKVNVNVAGFTNITDAIKRIRRRKGVKSFGQAKVIATQEAIDAGAPGTVFDGNGVNQPEVAVFDASRLYAAAPEPAAQAALKAKIKAKRAEAAAAPEAPAQIATQGPQAAPPASAAEAAGMVAPTEAAAATAAQTAKAEEDVRAAFPESHVTKFTGENATPEQIAPFYNHAYSTLDALYEDAQARQDELVAVGREIAANIEDVKLKVPPNEEGAPERNGLKSKATAKVKIERKGYLDTSRMTDVIRIGYNIKHPGQAAEIIRALARHFEVIDEGWNTTPNGYFDRKALLRFDDGRIGEVQFWEPHVLAAKEDKNAFPHITGGVKGSVLYDEWRVIEDKASPRALELRQQMNELYAHALSLADKTWATVLKEGRLSKPEPKYLNLKRQFSSDMMRQELQTSAKSASTQSVSPGLSSALASKSVYTTGRFSQLQKPTVITETPPSTETVPRNAPPAKGEEEAVEPPMLARTINPEANVGGFEPALRDVADLPASDMPAKPLVLSGSNPQNAAAQIAGVDQTLKAHPNPEASNGAWARMMAYALGTNHVPAAPYRFIRDIKNGAAAIISSLRGLTQGQIADANHGFENAAKLRKAYLDGRVTPKTTGKLFLWSFLSRGASPYVQESMFIDAYSGIDRWLDIAARGEFTEATIPAYREWASSLAPAGSGKPGGGATSNLNSFGEDFLLKMSRRDADGVSVLQKMHNHMSDPKMTGQKIRRWFHENVEGVGIDNKVLSFTLLVAGYKDVMVLDRVQFRALWDDGRYAGQNLYDGRTTSRTINGKEKRVIVTGSGLAKLGDGVRGLLVYEALERAIQRRVGDIYKALGRQEAGSIGRYHWETWVADSAQEASHGTLGAVISEALGEPSPMAGVTAKEGEYGRYSYGVRYGLDSNGTPYFLYAIPGERAGSTRGEYRFTLPAFHEFLAAIKDPKNGVVPLMPIAPGKGRPGYPVTTGTGQATEAIPWYSRPEINREKLDEVAARYGQRTGVRGRTVQGNAQGQELSDGPRLARARAAAEGRGGTDRLRSEAGAAQAVQRAGEAQEVEPLKNLYKIYPSSVGPNALITAVKRAYMASRGMLYRRQAEYVRADPARGKRIADAFTAMKHDPSDPEVAAAYRAFIDETVAQFRALQKALKLKLEFIKPGQPDPYHYSPRMALQDVLDNGHLWTFPTGTGIGTSGAELSDNPLMEKTGIVVDGIDMLANDVFRIVHDIFGHAPEGAGFGPSGEENAWQSHVRMYSPLAARAMTSETRGQNSWVNFGPHGEHNRAKPKETIFADQKVGLLPEWASTEGLAADDPTAAGGAFNIVEQFPGGSTSLSLSDEFVAQAQALLKTLRKELNRLGLKDVPLRVGEMIQAIVNGEAMEADGRYFRGIIDVALASPNDALGVLHHEALHAMRKMGLLGEKAEWPILARLSQKKWMAQFGIPELYSGFSKDKQIEEGVTHAYQAWLNGEKFDNFAVKAFKKIKAFIEAFGNALRGHGFQSSDDIFRRIYSGEVGARPRQGQKAGQTTPSKTKALFQIARHASNRYFEKFSNAHIGSGIGEALYGHGLYFGGSSDAGYLRKFGGIDYKVDIPDNDTMLNWDEPLSEMSKGVQAKVEKLAAQYGDLPAGEKRQVSAPFTTEDWARIVAASKRGGVEAQIKMMETISAEKGGHTASGPNGSEIYSWLGRKLLPNGSKQERSLAAGRKLTEIGIPGHQYFNDSYDGYVVYDPDSVKILTINDRPVTGKLREQVIEDRVQSNLSATQPVPKTTIEPGHVETDPEAPRFHLVTPPNSQQQASQVMQGFFARGQAFDRAIRAPFALLGGLDAQGRLVPGKRLGEVIGRGSASQRLTPAQKQGAGIGMTLGAGIGGIFGGLPGAVVGGAVGSTAGAYILGSQAYPTNGRFGWMAAIAENAKRGLIDGYGLDPAYIEAYEASKRGKAAILRQAQGILKVLSNAGVGSNEAVVLQRILTGAPVNDTEMTRLAVPIRQAIDDMGAEAVSLGLISAESFQRNRGAYLHRVYLEHEASSGDTLSRWVSSKMSSRRMRIIGDELKGRGMFWEVPIERLQRLGGAITSGTKYHVVDRLSSTGTVAERIFLPANSGRGVPPVYQTPGFKYRGSFEVRGDVRNGKATLWRDYTEAERGQMGELLDARYTIAKTFMLMSNDLASGRFFRDVAQNPAWSTDVKPPDGMWKSGGEYNARNGRFWEDPNIQWVLVPDTAISETGGKKRWGALAGRYVRAEIWRDLNEIHIANNPGTWRKLLTQWKKNKTARNPVVHMNNIGSNFAFMDLADVRMQDFVAGLKSYVKGDALFQEALDNGAFGSDMIAQEIREQVMQPILDEIAKQNSGGASFVPFLAKMGAMGTFADRLWTWAKAADNGMLRAYQMEDEIFRMATYMRRRSQGESPQVAAMNARDQFLNYDIRAPWVVAARNSVLPFVSYTYRAVPKLMENVMDRPWKLAKYALLAYAINALSYLWDEGDDDDEERQRAALRKEEEGWTWIGSPRMIRMPWRDPDGLPVFLDIRRWIPAGDIFDTTQGNSAMPIPAPLHFGGPLQIAFELYLNRQAFTGQDITNPLTQDPAEQAAGVADFLWKAWAPAAFWTPYSWYWNRIGNAIYGARDVAGHPYSVPTALLSSIGIKLKAVDVDNGIHWRMYDFQKEQADLTTELRALARQRERGLISDDSFNSSAAAILAKRVKVADEIAAYAQRTAIKQ